MSSLREEKHLLGQYAGFFTRLLAYLIDVVILVSFSFIVTLIVSSLVRLLGVDLAKCPSAIGYNQFQTAVCQITTVSLLIFNLCLAPVYLLIFWTLAGQTLGKGVMGVRIVRLNGKRMTLFTSIKRLIGYLVSILTLGLGFLWILADDRRQGFHDKLANTCVIYSWKARMDERFLWRVVAGIKRRLKVSPRPEPELDAGLVLRRYRIAVINLDQPGEAYRAFDCLRKIDQEDPARVLAVSLVEKDDKGELIIKDAAEVLAAKSVKVADPQALDMRLHDVLETLRRNRSAVVAVVDQENVDGLAEELPMCDVVIYRVDVTPEYVRGEVAQPPDGLGNQAAEEAAALK